MKANRLLRGMMLYLGTAMCIGLCGCTDSGNTSRGTIDDVRDDETAETTPADTPAAPDIIDPNFDVYTQKSLNVQICTSSCCSIFQCHKKWHNIWNCTFREKN